MVDWFVAVADFMFINASLKPMPGRIETLVGACVVGGQGLICQ